MPSIVAGRYEPVAKIASGGMSTVYLAKAKGAPTSDDAPAAPTRPRPRRTHAPSSVAVAAASPRPIRVVYPRGGWAAFRFDGTAQRSTPTTVAGVRPGRHTVEVQPYGQGAWIRSTIDVPSGSGPHIVRISLPPPSE